MEKRLPLYDKAKGIGIILLVAGHLFTHNSIPFALIFAFHMPLFFFISGIFFKPEASIKKLFFSYFLPFVFFQFLIGGIIIIPMSYVLHQGFGATFNSMLNEVYLKAGSSTVMMESLWFLWVLAISLIICKMMMRLERALTMGKVLGLSGGGGIFIYQLLTLVALVILAIICSRIPKGCLPLRLTAVPGVVMIIYLSSRYGNKVVDYAICQKWYTILVVAVFFLVAVLVNTSFNSLSVNISTPIYNDYGLYCIGAILGIIIVFWLSNKTNSKFLEFLGRNSLILFAVHGIWLRVYSLIFSYISGEGFQLVDNIPHLYVLPGCLFVLMMSLISFYCLKGIYRLYYNSLKKILNY